MDQTGALGRFHAFHEQFPLALHAFVKRQIERRFHGIDTLERGEKTPGTFLQLVTKLVEDIAALVRLDFVGDIPNTTYRLAFVDYFLRIGHAHCADIVAFFDGIENAQRQGILGTDKFTGGDHFQGFAGAGQARQPLGAASTRQKAQLHFRQAYLGAANRNPVMTAQSGFQATTQGGAMDRGNQRLVAVFKRVDQCRQRGLLHGFAEFTDVGTGNKGASFTNQQERPGLGIFLALLQGCEQTGTNSLAEGVYRRVVHGNNADVAFPVIANDLRHDFSSHYF